MKHLSFAALILFILPAHANEQLSHHRDGGGYINPYVERKNGGILNVIRSRLFTDEWQSYDPERDQVPTTAPEPAQPNSTNATVTWIGHATVLIQHQGINVLTDPMFSKRASPLGWIGPARITQPAIAIEDLPPIHAVVISHDHYDHLDTASISQLGDAPTYFVPLGLKQWFTRKGIAPDRVIEMDWWDSQMVTVGDHSVSIQATPSQHFSGRSLTDRNKTLWASWSIVWPDFMRGLAAILATTKSNSKRSQSVFHRSISASSRSVLTNLDP